MNYYSLFLVILSLVSCTPDNDEQGRDLSQAVSFTDLIKKRMKNDETINGATVLINNELNSYFDQTEGCAINPMPCTEENFDTEIGEPLYQGSGVGSCSGYGFELINDVTSEKVIVDLDKDTQFFILTQEESVLANFYAEIEFVERQAWCGAQMNYGINITLKEGEEDYLLDQFTQ
mgnify:FL=1